MPPPAFPGKSTKGLRGEAEINTHTAGLLSVLKWGEDSKRLWGVRLQTPWGPCEHLQPICLGPQFGFRLFLLLPDSSGHTSHGNKYPQSTE